MTQSNNDIEELEELLTELEGQEAQLVRPYAEDDDAVTQLMDAPLGDQEWMVQVTALDRRMMSTEQVLSELRAGKLSARTLVWRGGMDDWQPIARVESLSQAGMSQGGMAPGGMLPGLSAPGAGRLGALAPLPAPPMWSALPSAAPLPPPPAALAQSSGMSMGLPLAAQAPLPPPSEPALPRAVSGVPAAPATMSSSGNSARPVAIDFSDMVEDTSSPLRGKRTVLALSAVGVLAVFISIYALSSKSDGTPNTAAASNEQPRAVSALQLAPAEKKGEAPVLADPAKPAEPVAAGPTSRPSDGELAANEASIGSSARTTAPARYSPRSEYRRRSRGGSSERGQDDSESAEASAAEVPARSAAPARAAAAEEEAPTSEPAPVAGVASDDADATEAPRSTGKSSNTFNREAAKSALAEAASQAKNCRPAGGPSGTGRVEVHYEPSGKVGSVNILTSKFENTTTGSCVRMLFRRAKVPEFTGAPVVTVSKSFEIP
jgi:GYF domain 2